MTAKFFDGPRCRRCSTVQRYISTGACVACCRARTSKDGLPLDGESAPRPLVVVVKNPGQCSHGVGFRIPCRQCEAAFRTERAEKRPGRYAGMPWLNRVTPASCEGPIPSTPDDSEY